jgi:hypothetical protein
MCRYRSHLMGRTDILTRMPFAIGDRVVVVETGLSGVVSGISYENELPDTHVAYAVTVDGGVTTMVAVHDLRPE